MAFQKPGGRDPGKAAPTPTPRRTPTTRRTPISPQPKFAVASLTVTVDPPDSVVWLNTQQMPDLNSAGSLSLPDIKPGSYVLAVRHSGYRDQLRSLELKPGENDPISITLEPLKGTLSVRPDVDGTIIDVRSIERDQSVGSYAGGMDKIDFPPGEYELTISKPGYQVYTRAFTIKPGGLVELEPRINPLSAPTPSLQRVIATRSTVSVEGKYLVVSVIGTSADTSRTNGTINVTVNHATQAAYLQGSLNGLPCAVSFVSLENVAEGSLIESPSPSNGWAMVVIRVRPKDSKRTISFNINWSSVQLSSEPLRVSPINRDAFSPAVITYRGRPEYPQMARSFRNAMVRVSVLIDEEGKVKSAKAVDGPVLLRQAAENAARQCRFKPATQNGVPTQSTQEITFVFQPL
jgi:TonB family protein